jgi:hypothetical protein
MELVRQKYSEVDIMRKRVEVSQKLIATSRNIKNGAIKEISIGDLKRLFELYDEYFFNGWFKYSYKGKLVFSLSRRMTKCAGKTICTRNSNNSLYDVLDVEIRIGIEFFFNYGAVNSDNNVCGIKTNNSLEALQIVFEHELCHVIEFVNFKESACKGARFKAISNNLFGHIESYHQLPTHREIVQKRTGINIGDTVIFNFEDKKLRGILQSINKRATVMVPDKNGTFSDNRGNKYVKYYVPLARLNQIANV